MIRLFKGFASQFADVDSQIVEENMNIVIAMEESIKEYGYITEEVIEMIEELIIVRMEYDGEDEEESN